MAVLAALTPAGADENARRDARLQPERVMDAVGIRPGMVVGEAGAGRGYFTFKLARRVGASGKVYANDIDAGSLAYLRERCQRDGIENVVTILGRMEDPLFPAGSMHMVFMVNTYHYLARPVVLLRNLIPALKPGAIVAVVEHDPEKSGAEFQKESRLTGSKLSWKKTISISLELKDHRRITARSGEADPGREG
jgi:ubiquinone/menaquinone biosynthesis C-methylase UbiE